MAQGPSDLKAKLETFWKSTLQGLDTAREAVVQTTKAGRIQVELALLGRRRREALLRLGETVARLAADGRITAEELPELEEPFRRLEEIDEQIAAEERRLGAVAAGQAGDAGEAGPAWSASAEPEPAPRPEAAAPIAPGAADAADAAASAAGGETDAEVVRDDDGGAPGKS